MSQSKLVNYLRNTVGTFSRIVNAIKMYETLCSIKIFIVQQNTRHERQVNVTNRSKAVKWQKTDTFSMYKYVRHKTHLWALKLDMVDALLINTIGLIIIILTIFMEVNFHKSSKFLWSM